MGIRILFSVVLLCCVSFGRTQDSGDPEAWEVGDTINFFENGGDYNWRAIQLKNPYVICAYTDDNMLRMRFEGRIAINAVGTFREYKGYPPIQRGDIVHDGKYLYKAKKTFILQNGFKEELAVLELVN